MPNKIFTLPTVEATLTPIHSYRPVIIKFDVGGDKRGLFHGWFSRIESKARLLDTTLYGIIELASGEIIKLEAGDFKFLDSKIRFDQLCWFDDEAGSQGYKPNSE